MIMEYLVEHFGGVVETDDVDAVLSLVRSARVDGFNDMWISRNGVPFPCLGVLLSERGSCVHYMETEGEPGFRSLRHASGDGALARFAVGTPKQISEVDESAVVSVEDAAKVVGHFLERGDRSGEIEWVEL